MQTLDYTLPLETNKKGWTDLSVVNQDDDTITIRFMESGRYTTAEFVTKTGVYCGHEQMDSQTRLRNQSADVAHHYFRVWFGREDWAKDQWRYAGNDREFQFEDGKTAAQFVKDQNAAAKEAGSPWRFIVKPHTEMSPDHKWRGWMERRFATGEYGKLPWSDEEWAIKDHYAHPSLADPFKVAFVACDVDGVADKMSVLAPGKYLQQYYSDKLNPQEVAAWATKVDKDCELKFAHTPDEIERVYTTASLDSCMRYEASHFAGKIQPTRVYGAGDLAVAYLERRGKIIARALCWPEKKIVSRVYGDSSRFGDRMLAEGFELLSSADARKFDGARLLKITRAGETVMPYLDWELHAKDNPKDPDTLLISKTAGTYSGKSTNGIASGRAVHICGAPDCEEVYTAGATGSQHHHATGRNYCAACSPQLQPCNCCGRNVHNGVSGENIYPFRTTTGRDTSDRICNRCVRDVYNNYSLYEGTVYKTSALTRHPETGVKMPRHLMPPPVAPAPVVAPPAPVQAFETFTWRAEADF